MKHVKEIGVKKRYFADDAELLEDSKRKTERSAIVKRYNSKRFESECEKNGRIFVVAWKTAAMENSIFYALSM